MKKYIEHLQKKPEHVRRKILIILVPVFTIIIASSWLSIKKLSPSSGNVAAVRAAAPSEIFGGDLKSIWGSLKEGIIRVFQGK
ncbi:MAG: hypothetical protein AAB355_02660 [Patescibacteria group bacterium]